METTAKKIMATQLHTVTPDTTVAEVLRLLVNQRITGMPVVDGEGKLIGIVSEFDILNQIHHAKDLNVSMFKEVIKFTQKIDTIGEDAELTEILQRFIKAKYRRLPVVDENGILKGIITRRDLMKVFYFRARIGEDETQVDFE